MSKKIAIINKYFDERIEAIIPPLIPPITLIGITQKDSFIEICPCLNKYKKLENALTVLDTLFAPIAEWMGIPKSSMIGKLINPPPPAKVPKVVATIPVKNKAMYSN